MKTADHIVRAAVAYRATRANGKDVGLRLVMPPADATMGDAWNRLSAAYDDVDPTSIEIEIREFDPPPVRSRGLRLVDVAAAVLG